MAREVGTEGKLGGQAEVKGVAGTWKDLTDNVNQLAGNLTVQLRDVSRVATAIASGDLSKKITVDARGEILQIKDVINTMVDQLGSFASEVSRVAREVGTEGKLGGQAEVRGVAGHVEGPHRQRQHAGGQPHLAGAQHRRSHDRGRARRPLQEDHRRRPRRDPRAEEHHQHDGRPAQSSFASEVTRVAKEVGTEGKLGGQAEVKGVAGTWRDLTDNVNQLAGNLTVQLRDVSKVATAIASGDLTQKITVEAAGEILQIKNVINTMTDQLNAFASEVTRVAREVGTEGKLGGQADVRGVAGTWRDLTDSVNSMAGNLTAQVRNIADVTTAVAKGDLSRKITVDVRGEILELKNTINTMVDQLSAFASEVTRVAREVGSEGKLGGQADVPGVAGTWKDLTDNVNFMAGNLTAQVRNIADVTTAVANGDLSKKITVDVRGEILELKNTINIMVDQLNAFASEVTRVAREVGTEGKLGGQAEVKGVAGTWKDLTDNVNSMAGNLTGQVRNIADVTTAVANGDLSKKITVDVRGEILELKNTINTMVDQLECVRLGSHARRARSRHRRQARRPGAGQGRRRHLEGPHRQRQLHGQQPDLPGAQHRRGHDGGRQRRPLQEDHRRRPRRDPRAEEHHQHDGRSAQWLRLGSHARGARGRHRRQAGRPGAGARRRRHLEGPDRQRQLHGRQPDQPGAQHRRGHHRGRQRRPLQEDHRRRARRDPRAEEHHQHDGRPARHVRLGSDPRRARGRHRRQARRPGARCRGSPAPGRTSPTTSTSWPTT